jgi:hypothetical protein
VYRPAPYSRSLEPLSESDQAFGWCFRPIELKVLRVKSEVVHPYCEGQGPPDGGGNLFPPVRSKRQAAPRSDCREKMH